MSQPSNEGNPSNFDPAQEQGAEAIQSPHDRLLNRALMQRESAQELIRSHLPSEFVQYLKLDTLQQVDTSFIDANLKRSAGLDNSA